MVPVVAKERHGLCGRCPEQGNAALHASLDPLRARFTQIRVAAWQNDGNPIRQVELIKANDAMKGNDRGSC